MIEASSLDFSLVGFSLAHGFLLASPEMLVGYHGVSKWIVVMTHKTANFGVKTCVSVYTQLRPFVLILESAS